MNKPYRGAEQSNDRRNSHKKRDENGGQGARNTYGRAHERTSDRNSERNADRPSGRTNGPHRRGPKSAVTREEASTGMRHEQFSSPSRGPRAPLNSRGPKDADDFDMSYDTDNQDMSETQDHVEQAVLPGIKPVLELLDSDPARIDTVLIRRGRRSTDTDTLMDKCRLNHVRFNLVDGPALEKLYTGAHQGVVARLYAAGYIEVDEMLTKAMDAPLPIIIALDQVQDPGNAGTLARSLYALGGAGLIVPRHNAAYLGASAQRAAAGALEKLPVARVTNLARALDDAIDAGFTVYGAMLGDNSVNAFTTKLHTPCILVLGNEDKGIRPNVAKRCHKLLHIPMLRDFDSLNVAQAGALLLGEFARDLLVGK
ncbi:MAG: 23S rRNA (guanosine(2251)-2'-O)-methyltransferase RlmB [Pseudomonadota bacterium]